MISLPNSPFIVGVSGHIDLREDEIEPLKRRIEIVLRFLISSDNLDNQRTRLDRILDLLPQDEKTQEASRAGLENWPHFRNTPLVVMTSLAPGADSIMADVALKLKKEGLNVHVVAPLPIHNDLYRQSTTFKPDGATATEIKEKQKRYDELLQEIGPENTFCVRMQSDLELAADEFKKQCESDRDNQDATKRHGRYYAAGEFIADHSHLLIAVWDHQHDRKTDSGTAAVVHARRSHTRFEHMPTNGGLNLPHGGPLLQLYTHRQRNNGDRSKDAFARFLHCSDSEPTSDNDDTNEFKEALARWQFNSLSIFNHIAANLERFNSVEQPGDDAVDGEIRKFLTPRTGDDPDLGADPNASSLTKILSDPASDSDFLDGFRHLSRVRTRAKFENYSLLHKADFTLMLLFWLALLAAAFVHLFAEWHPQKPAIVQTDYRAPKSHSDDRDHDHFPLVDNLSRSQGVYQSRLESASISPTNYVSPLTEITIAEPVSFERFASDTDSADESSNGSDSFANDAGHETHAELSIRFLIGVMGLVCALAAICWFWRRRSHHHFDRAYDYRAIAEGMRVQMFWNLAGLGKSVPANYMQRQRSEFDWIRGVIRAASLPYDRWKDRSLELDRASRVISLRCILGNWIGEQLNYFRKSRHKKHYEMHSWHQVGGLLALAGLLGILLQVASCFFDWHHPLGWLQSRVWLGILLTIILGLIAALIAVVRRNSLQRRIDHQTHEVKMNPNKRLEKLKYRLFWLVDHCVIKTEPHSTQVLTSNQERQRMALNFVLGFFPAAATLAMAIATIGAIIANVWSTSPDATVWTSVIVGVFLVAGALCVAWTEKRLDSEFAYQYSTMYPLFRAAHHRCKPLVDALGMAEQIIADGSLKDGIVEELKKSNPRVAKQINDNPEKAFDELVREIQCILYELGTEALDENAEWLILHRARPLEPVMAG